MNFGILAAARKSDGILLYLRFGQPVGAAYMPPGNTAATVNCTGRIYAPSIDQPNISYKRKHILC